MKEPVGGKRQWERAYAFNDISLVPSAVTVDPHDVDISTDVGGLHLDIPFLASAMDGVVDVGFAVALSELGGLAVLNSEGLSSRYEDPAEPIQRIADASRESVVDVIREVYRQPFSTELLARTIQEVKDNGARIAVSATPKLAAQVQSIAEEMSVDLFVIQATIVTARHKTSSGTPLDLSELLGNSELPTIIGNCVTYEAALELMETGAQGVLVGVGPGAACTTRRVLGVGVPQVTAICAVASARDDFLENTGRRVAVIADGGMRCGGDIAKAIVCGADAVMLGSPFAATQEAAGRGFNWGMATADPGLPRGTRVKMGKDIPLHRLIFGPAGTDEGTENLAGALRLSMAVCGATEIEQMQQAQAVIAPSLDAEGKRDQREQGVGMGK